MENLDKAARYRRILQEIVERYAQTPRRAEQVPLVPICDTVHDNYLLMRVGWDAAGRAHHTLFHLRLQNGKVWIEDDGIESGIANDLLAAGIEKDGILFAAYGREPKLLKDLAIT